MDGMCSRGDWRCEVSALSAALHALHLYCATIATILICCCAPLPPHWYNRHWNGQNVRGVASLVLAAVWCGNGAVALLRPVDTVHLVSALLAPLAWLAAAALHVTLWSRRSTAPILYLALYWLLCAFSAGANMWQHLKSTPKWCDIEIYIQGLSIILATIIGTVDCICFYDEVLKRNLILPQTSTADNNIIYKHNETHFYSMITFYWINLLLYRGYESPLEQDDLGEIPEDEYSEKHYQRFKLIYEDQMVHKTKSSIWQCYFRLIWPNFYIAGFMKLISDVIGVVPPLGLAIIIKFIESPHKNTESSAPVTFEEFFSNGYVMLSAVGAALIGQAFLSQNSTHLVTVEGSRLKCALQTMVYDKCMKLAPWSNVISQTNEDSPLLLNYKESSESQTGLLTNLVSQDTYNIMSCVWIIHYLWAIPLKVTVILYILYTKLGISAIIGTAISILVITPLQFYIGKKLSHNSKLISKCTDHRMSKMSEILKGMNVIKLYVWEDLFKEKILQLREVELKFLNKDSIYWSLLTFTTQMSTILITVITFTVFYFLGDSAEFTSVNVFAGMALFNQLTIPLLILPVTVLMVIEALVSTKRIQDFLDLPESNNICDEEYNSKSSNGVNEDYNITRIPGGEPVWNNEEIDKHEIKENENHVNMAHDEPSMTHEETSLTSHLIQFRNAIFTWGTKCDSVLEIEDLKIPTGKLIMVVGTTSSGKSSLLSAILGEMLMERGEVNGNCSTWYAGQPPWLIEGSVRDNIVMESFWSQKKYSRVVRATGLWPDLQLLPEGDATKLGSQGAPLSGGQRVRVCVARALYSDARLVALDEPLAALDAPLARHLVCRALLPAARIGRTLLVATNRLELLHYADLIIAMEDGRIAGFGRPGGTGVLGEWGALAASARTAAARGGAGPPGGTARERSRLVRAFTIARFRPTIPEDAMISINEATGAHFLAELRTCAGGSWRRSAGRLRPSLSKQISSPPCSVQDKWRNEVRRSVSVDASGARLQREASVLMRLLQRRPHHTLTRWTPRALRRLISAESEIKIEENRTNVADGHQESLTDATCESTALDNDTSSAKSHAPFKETRGESELKIWVEYGRACGWWGAVYCAAAAAAQALALLADVWLARTTEHNKNQQLSDHDLWHSVLMYGVWCVCGAVCGLCAQAGCGCAGGAARRRLHDRLLHAALHAPPHHTPAATPGAMLHRFSADILVVDKKLQTAVSRWMQLALLCGAALLVNAVVAPWSLLALLPAVMLYFTLQSVYLRNARELQRAEASSAASVVSLCAETSAGAATLRVARLQPRMRAAFARRLNRNQNALLLLNAANRWLGFTLDLVGAGSVCVSLGLALCGGAAGGAAGLAGAYSLLLPAYLAHLAKCRADVDLQLASVERLTADTNVPHEDYRDDCPIPANWQRKGKIEFKNASIQHEPQSPVILNSINFSIAPGEKVAVCGRSGSGKSTLLLSCVGATNIASGRILVDGEDSSRVPLRQLRHRIVVLPQEPVMFSGTLRENLDPLAVHTDEEIWQSLRAVGLFDYVSAQAAGLECVVGRWRSGWGGSRAARVCAARAVLHARRAAALLLDEPGAALDSPAERALLANIRNSLPNTTIVIVAHRASSVVGYDRVLVVEGGHVSERAAPPDTSPHFAHAHNNSSL